MSSVRSQEVLSRLSEMNNVALTVAPLNPAKAPPSPGEVIKQMVEVTGDPLSKHTSYVSAARFVCTLGLSFAL